MHTFTALSFLFTQTPFHPVPTPALLPALHPGDEQSCPDPEAFRADMQRTFDLLREAEERASEEAIFRNNAEALSSVLELVRQHQVSFEEDEWGARYALICSRRRLRGWRRRCAVRWGWYANTWPVWRNTSGGMACSHLFKERVVALGLRKRVCGEGVHWQERGMKRESTYAEVLGVPHLGGRGFLESKRGTAPPVGMVKGRE